MSQAPDRETLIQRAKQLAYEMLDNDNEWEDVQLPPDYLGADADDDIELVEIDAQGNERPMTEETRERFQNERINITSSKSCTIPVPDGWSDEEVKLATLLLEGAMFKLGANPFMFNSPDAGSLFSADLMRNQDDEDDKHIRMTTNVIGELQSYSLAEISEKIDETMNDIQTGWKNSLAGGKMHYSKPVDISGDFPFLFEWLHSYARCADQEKELKPTIGYDMCNTHNDEENRRYALMLNSLEMPPIISVGAQRGLIEAMLEGGFEFKKTQERQL